MQQGDIVILEFPYANTTHTKVRPALVLSNKSYNKHANVLLVGIYGKKQPCAVRITNNDLQKKRLRKESFVSIQNIFSADKSLIKQIVDSVTEKTLARILTETKRYL